jgi:hypothetical protein
MIDFYELKAQLQLLGHELPDTQVLSILADMRVQVFNAPGAPQGKLLCFLIAPAFLPD